MKILIVANYLPDRQISMLNIARMLEDGLKNTGHEVKVIRPEKMFCGSDNSIRGINKWLGYLDKFLLFPGHLKKHLAWADVVHICDHSNAIYTKYLQGVPHVVTCHDLLAVRSALGDFKDNQTKLTGKVFQKMILSGLRRAQKVVCISRATQKDLLRISRIEERKTSVAYLGLNYTYHKMDTEEAKKIMRCAGITREYKFLLNVSKNNWYKNRKGLICVYELLKKELLGEDLHLIIAGEPLPEDLKALVRRSGLEESVHEIIAPDNGTLCALYSTARSLLYPSIAEGFGWPIVEAQASGCPVFTSNRAPMTEAGGDAAVYFDPDDPEGAAKIIVETLADKQKLDEMRQKGIENVKRFDSGRMIDEYVAVYREVIVAHSS